MPMFMHTGYQVTAHFEDMCIYGALVKNITSTQNKQWASNQEA